MIIINKVSAETWPNWWESSMKECMIKWKIVYFRYFQQVECGNLYDAIVKDDNNYYNITIKETLPTFMYFSEDTTRWYEKACEWYSLSWTTDISWNITFDTIKPNVWDEYYFKVIHHYYFDNMVMKYSKQQTNDWNILPNCSDNIIDKINKPEIVENTNKSQEQNIKIELIKKPEISKNIDISNNIIYSILLLIILLPILSIFIYKKVKKV